jgi:hypothetical protein
MFYSTPDDIERKKKTKAAQKRNSGFVKKHGGTKGRMKQGFAGRLL